MTSLRSKLITWIADHPASFLGRIAALRFGRPRGQSAIGVPHFASKPVRALIAPVNYSAQAIGWARALEAADDRVSVTNLSIAVPGGFAFGTDLEVPLAVYHNGRDWQQRAFDAVAANATHVLIEALEPPFGRAFGRSVERQAAELSRRGVRIGYMQHGTEVRVPSRHAESDPWSYYRDDEPHFARAEQVAQRNVAYLNTVTEPVFVSTPDLLDDLPFATWCPVVVNPEAWRAGRSRERHGGPLRVSHAPSNPNLKGTPRIAPVLKQLAHEGLISLRLVRGVSAADMPALYADTDVYLDQFRLGSYGVAACEAMAAGCAVIGHVSAPVRARVAAETGQALPIIEATPDTIEQALRALAADRAALQHAAESGARFVSSVHDGRRSSRVLLDRFLLEGAA